MIAYAAWVQWRRCGRKKPLRQAWANTIVVAARLDGDLALQAYECGYCGSWHVGHPAERDAERGAA